MPGNVDQWQLGWNCLPKATLGMGASLIQLRDRAELASSAFGRRAPPADALVDTATAWGNTCMYDDEANEGE